MGKKKPGNLAFNIHNPNILNVAFDQITVFEHTPWSFTLIENKEYSDLLAIFESITKNNYRISDLSNHQNNHTHMMKYYEFWQTELSTPNPNRTACFKELIDEISEKAFNDYFLDSGLPNYSLRLDTKARIFGSLQLTSDGKSWFRPMLFDPEHVLYYTKGILSTWETCPFNVLFHKECLQPCQR